MEVGITKHVWKLDKLFCNMKQTLIGLGSILVGLLAVAFSESLARTSRSINRYTGGFRPSLKVARTFNVLAGVIFIIGGLLLLLRLMSLPALLH